MSFAHICAGFFAQILWVSRKSSNYLIFFCLDLVSLAQIWWQFDFFCSGLVSFAQIRRRSGEKYKLLPKMNLRQHFVDFDWPDCQSFQSDLTWPVSFCGRQRVFSPETWCRRVSCRLGTNPTWTDPWTLLGISHYYLTQKKKKKSINCSTQKYIGLIT